MAGSLGLSLFLAVCIGAAYYSMWVVGTQNGLQQYAAHACNAGTMRTTYTGASEVDKVLCILVSVLEAAGARPEYAPFNAVFLTVFAVPLVILHLEGSRPSQPLLVRLSPLVFSTAAQLVGAGLALPIYFLLYNIVGGSVGPTSARANKLRTVAPSLGLAMYATAVAMTDASGFLTRDQKGIANAAFQVFPLTVGILQIVLQLVLPSTTSSPSGAKRSTLTAMIVLNTIVYYKAAHDFHVLSHSVGSYLDTLKSVILSPLHPVGFAETAHLFLLFDFLSCFVTSFAFIAFAPGVKTGSLKVVLGMVVLTPVIGPGAAMLWGWRSRGNSADKDGKGKKKV